MKQGEDPIFYPTGRPYETPKEVYKWMESQRRRSNLLMFAIIWKETETFAGVVGMCCDPTQGTLDVRGLSGKVLPEFRRRGIIVHTTWLKSCYLLDPIAEGGLGLVRVTWRCIPENKESAGAALKCGYTYEGTMRRVNYTVYGPGSHHRYARPTPDNTGRVVEDGMVFSLTLDDWLVGGKRENLRLLVEKK
ncbi:hypothetical protein CPB86DRAFT_710753 [Serendipita vermifera]|nr:hypothetical protein CPB86DRAFT_710753 [Serendipita vermifera]